MDVYIDTYCLNTMEKLYNYIYIYIMNCIYIIILLIILFLLINMYEEFDTCRIVTCASDFILINNKCIKNINCPIGQYNNDGICTNCNPVANVFNLTSYDSNCKVTKCTSGYYLNNIDNTCTSTCASGYTLNSDYCFKNNTCSINEVNINNICTSYTTEYIFTNCSATGRLGPTLKQCETSYLNTNLGGQITMSTDRQGIQIWSVPITGRYLITVAGAGIDVGVNCKGVIISSVFTLNIGEKIKILIGQSGVLNNAIDDLSRNRYSGSGGTFVVKFTNDNDYTKENNIPMIIAGGGGGINQNSINENILYDLTLASFNTSGKDSFKKSIGGINGESRIIDVNNTQDKYIIDTQIGTPGSFYKDGNNSSIQYFKNYYYGYSFLNGGNGALCDNGINFSVGGFGGGSASTVNFSGSGGGYSGGCYGISYYGSGGGSYSSEKMNIVDYNNKMGYVNIKYLGI